jgi:hypothetical protein
MVILNTLGDLIRKMPDWYLTIHRADDTVSMAWLFSSSRRNLWDGQNRLPLDRCIDLFACMECEDPHDKVYGLLGLASGCEHPEIDYRKPLPEVFLDTVTALRKAHWRRCLENGKIEGRIWAQVCELSCFGQTHAFPVAEFAAILEEHL